MLLTPSMPTGNRLDKTLCETPLVAVQMFEDSPVVWCKLEFLNPSGSTKDRMASYILEKAWRQKLIGGGSLIVEASSGSTSIALARVCAQMGLRFIAVMPYGVSNERIWMIRAYGGTIVIVPECGGMPAAIARAEEIARETGGYFTRQFENEDNPESHRITTAREILRQVPNGSVQAFVSGVGTGGTLIGVYQGLDLGGSPVIPVLALPVTEGSHFQAECCSFSSRIPGVVDGLSELYKSASLPGLMEIEVSDEIALRTARDLIRRGFPVGPSSGLNFAAASVVAKLLGKNACVVTVFPDRMERYFSTELFAEIAGTQPYTCID